MKLIRSVFRKASEHYAADFNRFCYRFLSGDSVDRLISLRMPNAGIIPYLLVDPNRIEYKCNIRGSDATTDRLFREGNWDLARKPFADVEANDPRYVTCRELVRERVPIEMTMEFTYLLGRIRDRGRAHGSSSREELLRYMNKLSLFYEEIVREGRLRSQVELGKPPHGGEINCAVGRDGTLFKTDRGNHRFAIARLLGFKEVPVQISVIHRGQLEIVRSLGERSGLQAVNEYMRQIEERYRA